MPENPYASPRTTQEKGHPRLSAILRVLLIAPFYLAGVFTCGAVIAGVVILILERIMK